MYVHLFIDIFSKLLLLCPDTIIFPSCLGAEQIYCCDWISYLQDIKSSQWGPTGYMLTFALSHVI